MSYGYTWNGHDPYDSPYTYQTDSPFHIPAYRGSYNSPPAQVNDYAATAHEYDTHFGNERLELDRGLELDAWDPPHPTQLADDQARRAAEYGLTPQELQEISLDCIREQEILEQEYQEEMREAREARREALGAIGEVEEIEYEQQEWLANQSQVGTHLPLHNYEQGPLGDWADDQDELPPRMPPPPTFYEPEYNVYEAYGMAD